jgi:hypothetical protein
VCTATVGSAVESLRSEGFEVARAPLKASALEKLPDETVLDGEIVAVDKEGRSNFNLLQNFRSAELKIHYYAFDVLMHNRPDTNDRYWGVCYILLRRRRVQFPSNRYLQGCRDRLNGRPPSMS